VFTRVSVELLAYTCDDEMLLPSEDIPRDKRYMITDISKCSIPCEYSTLYHRILQEKTKVNSKEIIHFIHLYIHNYVSRGAIKGAIFET